jgi:hypothetical protein
VWITVVDQANIVFDRWVLECNALVFLRSSLRAKASHYLDLAFFSDLENLDPLRLRPDFFMPFPFPSSSELTVNASSDTHSSN